jgi:hypothetical protein
MWLSVAILATRPETAQACTLAIWRLHRRFLATRGGRKLTGMNGPPKSVENDRPEGAEKARRQRRLGVALRENLKRRKAQAKGRAAAGEKSHDSAGIAADKNGG